MNNDKLTFEQHVQSECLCLLGYFAHQAGRAQRSDIIKELADSTFAGKTPDAVARKNWWGRKFGNIAYTWNATVWPARSCMAFRCPPRRGRA